MIKVYFAGPDVFRNNPQEYFEKIEEKWLKYKVQPLFPFDSSLVKSDSIYYKNTELIKECNILIANLDPFRGPSIDVGTAFEIGYAKALGKPVVGYTESPINEYKTRVTKDMIEQSAQYPYVENFGLYDNLMISHSCSSIHESLDKVLYHIIQIYRWMMI